MLSMGAYLEVGSARVPMPALWLWKNVVVFRLIRAPSRFNLLVAVVAAVIAAGALRDILGRIPHTNGKRVAVVAVALF